MADVINIEQGRMLLGEHQEPRFDRLTKLACRQLQAASVCVGVPGVWIKSQAGPSQPIATFAHLPQPSGSVLTWYINNDNFYASYPLYDSGKWVALFYAQGPLLSGATQQSDFVDLAKQCQLLLDLRHQERLNQALLEQQKRQQTLLSTLYNSTQDALLTVAASGKILSCNPQATALLGHSPQTLLTMDIRTLLPWEEDSVREFTARAALDPGQNPLLGWNKQVLCKHADGQVLDLRVTVRELIWSHQRPEALEYLVLLNKASSHSSDASTRPSERALLNTIIDSIPYPVYARDCQGTYLIANKASQKLISSVIQGITSGDPNEQTYRDAVNLSEASHAQVIAEKTIHHSVMNTPTNESFTVTKSPIFDKEQNVIGVVTVTHEITELNKASQELDSDRHLLSVLHTGLTNYGALLSSNDVWMFLKRALRDLTKSEYALIGEVVAGHPRKKLKVHAISNLVQSAQSRKLMDQLLSNQMVMDTPDSLLGKTYLQGEMVLINDFEEHAPNSRFPPGHPKFKNYLGLPIMDQGEVIGMCAISTSPNSYSSELAAWLEPFLSTCSLMIKLHRQLDEQKKILSELQQAHRKAEEASQAKTEFLSRMSHELRTPLNAINGFAQLLLGAKQQPTLNPKQQRQAAQVLKNGQYLLELINEVLDLARIESGNLNLSMDSTDLLEAINDSIDSLEPYAISANISIHRPICAEKIWVQADLTRLCQVLINLLSNAIKYNHPSGQAWIKIASTKDKVRISVKDTGIGISPEKYSELFKPFNRLGAEHGTIEGTGVGLALAKKLIEMMDGQIGFSSSLNQGSEFWFELKAAAEKPRASHQPHDLRPAPASPTANQCSVLYIEDNPANLQLMQEIFEELEDFTLSCATSGTAGIQKAIAEQPQLIMLDINLPDLNGYQVLERLRAEPLTAKTVICGISANAMPKDIENARAAGFDLYLTKPLDLHKLFDHLETFKTRFQKAAD